MTSPLSPNVNTFRIGQHGRTCQKGKARRVRPMRRGRIKHEVGAFPAQRRIRNTSMGRKGETSVAEMDFQAAVGDSKSPCCNERFDPQDIYMPAVKTISNFAFRCGSRFMNKMSSRESLPRGSIFRDYENWSDSRLRNPIKMEIMPME